MATQRWHTPQCLERYGLRMMHVEQNTAGSSPTSDCAKEEGKTRQVEPCVAAPEDCANLGKRDDGVGTRAGVCGNKPGLSAASLFVENKTE